MTDLNEALLRLFNGAYSPFGPIEGDYVDLSPEALGQQTIINLIKGDG